MHILFTQLHTLVSQSFPYHTMRIICLQVLFWPSNGYEGQGQSDFLSSYSLLFPMDSKKSEGAKRYFSQKIKREKWHVRPDINRKSTLIHSDSFTDLCFKRYFVFSKLYMFLSHAELDSLLTKEISISGAELLCLTLLMQPKCFLKCCSWGTAGLQKQQEG